MLQLAYSLSTRDYFWFKMLKDSSIVQLPMLQYLVPEVYFFQVTPCHFGTKYYEVFPEMQFFFVTIDSLQFAQWQGHANTNRSQLNIILISCNWFVLACCCSCASHKLHKQIPATGYEGLILRSTTVTTASRSTVEGTMRVFWGYCARRLRGYCTCSRCRVPL